MNNVKIFTDSSFDLPSSIQNATIAAADFAEEGFNIHEIAEKVKDLVPKVKTAFVIDSLEYLYKGGRCSALQNLVGSMLKIRPIVRVVDGKMILTQKLMGKRAKALTVMLDSVTKNGGNISKERIMVTHSMSHTDAEFLKDALKNYI